MTNIENYLNQILSAVYGKDVRQSIHDAIKQCYDDVSNPTLNTEALKMAIQEKIDEGAMTNLILGDGDVSTEKIADKAVTKEKIADGSVTEDKIADSVIQLIKSAVSSIFQLDGIELKKTVVELDNVTYKVNNVLYAQDDVTLGSYYDPETGDIKTTTTVTTSAMSPMIPAISGSTIKLSQKVDVTFFDKKRKYVSGIRCNDSIQDVIVPKDAVWYVLSTSTWGSNFKTGTHEYVVVYVSAYASEWHYEIKDFGVPWETVLGTDGINEAVADVETLKNYINGSKESIETAGKLTRIFNIRKAVLLGSEADLFYDGFYAGYPFAASTNRTGIILYDEEMNFINVFNSDGETVNRIDVGEWALNNRDIVYFDGLNVTVETYVNMDQWNNRKPHEILRYTLSGRPKYIKTNRSYNFVTTTDVPEDLLWLQLDSESNVGFLEQINDYIQPKIEKRFEDDLGKRVKCISIREMNKSRDAIRIGTYNIYGAGHAQKNWQCVKEQLQDFGIDICAFQEVKSPNGNLDSTNTKIFADEMIGWQFPYCSSNGDLYPTNERMLLSAWEITSSSEVEFEQWTSDRRCLAKYEIQLPRYKDCIGGDVKISVYNTQLEVYPNNSGDATVRLAEAQEILDEIAKDKNPFIVVCMDSNDFSQDKEIWKLFEENGYKPCHDGTSMTVTDQSCSIDVIFCSSNMNVLNYNVINSNLYQFYDNGMKAVSDHDLLYADIQLDYSDVVSTN